MQLLDQTLEAKALFRRQFGSLLINNATRPKRVQARKPAISSLERLHARFPTLVTAEIQLALSDALLKERTDATYQRHNFAPILLACASFEDDAEHKMKSELLSDLLIVAHEPVICSCHPLFTLIYLNLTVFLFRSDIWSTLD